VTKVRTPLSLTFSREAWRRLAPKFLEVIRHPDNLAARGEMQLGACLAGLAIENSMLGAGHALANPLTARYGIAHGEAVALMLPHVVRRNADSVNGAYRDLWDATNLPMNGKQGGGAVADFLAESAVAAGLASRLRDQGVDRGSLGQLAADATKQWTGTFNPVPLKQPDFLALYEAAY
jgi:alcohol dehydrogenase